MPCPARAISVLASVKCAIVYASLRRISATDSTAVTGGRGYFSVIAASPSPAASIIADFVQFVKTIPNLQGKRLFIAK